MHASTPNDFTPPKASMPSYITTFQSSPVRICKEQKTAQSVCVNVVGEENQIRKRCRSNYVSSSCHRCRRRLTWNTVSRLSTKLSKLCRGFGSVSLKSNLPPKTCMPSSAKMTMNKNSSSNSEAIDWIELSNDATRFESDRQYLEGLWVRESRKTWSVRWENRGNWIQTSTVSSTDNPLKWKSQSEHRHETYLVTLNTRSSRTQRRTEIPSGGIMWVWQSTISIILPNTTKQSKRLNNDTKYPWNPKLYIFRNISMVNSATKNMFVYSVEKKKRRRKKGRKKRTDNTVSSWEY